MVRKIQLTHGQVALVDDEDYEWLNQWRWSAVYTGGIWYVRRRWRNRPLKLQGTIHMHRVIMNAPDNMEVDHVDGNGLNNQRRNLRLATHRQNMRNTRGHNKTGFKGVTYSERDRAFTAKIGLDGKSIFLGFFKNAEDAAKAYDEGARHYFGEFARTNF